MHFHCDVNYDPFLYMEDNNKTYGFTITMYEFHATIPLEVPVSPADLAPVDAPASSPTSVDHPIDQSPRRSTRVRNIPIHLRDYHCFSAILSHHEPHSYREASSNPLWQQAMSDELQALTKTNAWDLVDLPSGKTLVGCKWVYKVKRDALGDITKLKSRLVDQGYSQRPGFDYNINSAAPPKYVGLANYWYTNEEGVGLGILQTREWWQSVWNTVKFTLSSVVLSSLKVDQAPQLRSLQVYWLCSTTS